MDEILQKRLVKRLKARDGEAFEKLINEYQSFVFNLIYRMLGNREESEDLLQEVFITVFKKIDHFRGEATLSTWIYRIATNLCINRKKYLRRRKHYLSTSFSELPEKCEPGGNVNGAASIPRPDEMAEGRQMEMIVQQAISRLDEEHRVVLVLRDIQNLTYEQISQILDTPEGTVKSRLHRARMALKEKLKPVLR